MQNYAALLQQFNTHWENYTLQAHTPTNLYNPIQYFLALGGKRIRPIASMMAAEVFGKIDTDVLNAAAALEVFHNFTLVHDDIMDNAPTRRGQTTVHEKWNTNIAILSGDAICIEAYHLLTMLDVKYLKQVLHMFNTTATEVCIGQQMDMDFEQMPIVDVATYIEMISLKTSVLLAACMYIGALLGGASEADAQLLYAFGKNVGISFQIKDDYLDAYGTAESIGKQVGGDILASKKTFLICKAMEIGTDTQKATLQNLLASNESTKVAIVLELLHTMDIPKHTIAAKKYYSDLAFDCLKKLNVPDSKKEVLRNLALDLLERNN